MDFLYWQPLEYIAIALIALMIAAAEAGYRLGQRLTRIGASDAPLGTMQSALLALLGLLLAFTFGMANDRFETRKELVLNEANNIGTASLRMDMLREPWRSRSREIMLAYLRDRVEFYSNPETASDREALVTLLGSVAAHQSGLWEQAVAAAASDPHDHMVALYVDALNAVIDIHASRIAAGRNHVPETTLFLLGILATACAMSLGQSCGSSGHRHFAATTIFSLLIALVIVVIMDLDRPRRGYISVPQTPLTELLQDLEKASH